MEASTPPPAPRMLPFLMSLFIILRLSSPSLGIPCMNEEQGLLDSVLHGVPHECLIILVSNSNSSNFEAECKLLADFCIDTQRPGIVVHQRDEGLALAFQAAGMPEVVVETTQPQMKRSVLRVRNGKGEAMMIGTAIAKVAGKHFIGFIDADNFVAGSVHEYCKVYAAGLHHALHCTAHIDTNVKSHLGEEGFSLMRDGR